MSFVRGNLHWSSGFGPASCSGPSTAPVALGMLADVAAEGLDGFPTRRSPRFLLGPLAGPACKPAWWRGPTPAATMGPITFRPPWALATELDQRCPDRGVPFLAVGGPASSATSRHPRLASVPCLAPGKRPGLCRVPGHPAVNPDFPAGRPAPTGPISSAPRPIS